MKKLFTFLTMLLIGIGSMWGDVLPDATVGTYVFQANTLTSGASGHTISKDGSGNVTISPNNEGSYGATSGRFNCTLVVKINVPSTTTPGVLCEMRQGSANTTYSQGLYMAADRLLKTSWGASGRTNGTTIDAGEHTIIYTTGEEGAKVYVDGNQKLTDGGLKAGNVSYKAIYIPAAYAQYVTEVHFYPEIKSSSDLTSIATECSNHMHASQQAGTTASVASGKTLILDKAVSWTSLTGTGTVLQEVNINTTVAGNLPALTLKATAGTLTYTGTNLNGTTLDGVIIEGTTRITTSNTVTIKNLAGNNLSNTNNNYAFVGSGILNFYGTCDLTKKSDGTDCNSSKLGYGNTASINIKSGANVTTAEIYNTTTNDNNAMISIESGATLNATAEVRSVSAINQGTMNGTKLYGPITLGDGSITTLSDAKPFHDNSSTTGSVTVNGDATLNLTATTSTLTKAITVVSGKTLTIDGKTNTVNLTGAVTNNGTIHFKDAILNFTERDLSALSYTFDNCTLQFAETGDEYKNGGFTITNIPSGVTVKVKQYDGDAYETVTPEAGTATISHDVEVSGSAAWLDYTFNESTKSTNIHSPADRVITNAGNAGSGNNLTIDTDYNTDNSYNEDGTLKVMSTPWRNITWPTNYTVAVAGNVPNEENGCLVAFGSTTAGSLNYLAIVRGANQNEIKLVKGHGMNSAFEVISTMTAANATALSHLVVFTKNGNTFTVYLDGIQKTQVTYSDALGGGFQIGSIHGGVTGTGVGRVNDMATDIKNKIFAKAVRVYDYVISDDQMSQLTEEFPYTSFGGKYTRTITENSNLSATDAWLNTGTQGYVDIPVNAVVDEVTYYPDVEITTDAASTLTVNANMDAENIKFGGTGKLTIASDGEHNIHIYGSLTANGPVSVKYGEIDLTAVPVSIGESGSVEFDFSNYDFSSVDTPTDYPVTGNTADYGSKVTGVYPSATTHTYTLAHNGTSNNYILTVAPTVAFFQQRAINLATPYYNGGYVGTGLGKYIISLGETSYSNFVDFGTAVMSWQTLGDCVEPTIVMNMPTDGFYRIQSQNNDDNKGNVGKYLHNNLYDGGLALNTNDDMTSIFYIDRTNNAILSYADGKYLNYCDVEPSVGIVKNWTIEEGSEIGKYAIKMGSTWYASDWNTTANITFGQKDANALWAIEPVTSLPVTFKKAGLGYSTLYTPVALQIPENTNAYVCKLQEAPNNAYTLTFYEITAIKDETDHTTIPANTAVLLYRSGVKDGEEDVVVNFPITTCKDEEGEDVEITENSFYGTFAAEAFDPNSTETDIYSLRTYLKEDEAVKVGFYKKTAGTTCAGFKAWIKTDHPVNDEVRNIIISFDGVDDPTGIVEALGLENANVEIYDLNGRKMATYKKGINIVNGKKVLVK